MINGYIKALTPHAIALGIFIAISAAYFLPALSGKVLNQSDNVQALGMQKEINEVRGKGETHPLWTNSMFGGMPVYQIHLPNGNNFSRIFSKMFVLGGNHMNPFNMSFLLMTMFYILMVAMGVDWRIGLIGAITYALATNHIVLTEAGHTTKVLTMAYLPPTLAGIILAFRGKYVAGFALTALFMSLQMLANHIQITYYFFLALVFFGGFEFFRALKAKELPNFFKAVAVLLIAGMIGVASNTARLWTTYEYVDETIRGKSELSEKGPYAKAGGSSTAEEGEGLSKDYIFSWSYGIGETFTVLIPDYMGRRSGSLANDENSNTLAVLRALQPTIQQQNPQQANQIVNQLARAANTFRGDVPFTSGPIYYGSIICFLFVLGLFLVKGPMKWWLLSATILMAFLGWGRHFPAFNFFLYEHFPMFNKFRAVMMAIGVGQLYVTILAMLAIKELVFGKDMEASAKAKAVLMAGGITGGLCLLFWLGAMMGFIDFSSVRDAEILSQPQYGSLLGAIHEDRAAMLQADALRSFLFIALAAAALWLYASQRIKWTYSVIAVAVLVLIDFWGVDRRFLTEENFQTKTENRTQVAERPVDTRLINDTEMHFRVMDLSGFGGGDAFRSAYPSYFHKSMGGYHAAKLMRFQDLYEYYFFDMLQTGSPNLQNQAIMGMFNTKYFIMNNPQQNNQPTAFTNSYATGPSWFAREYEFVENADAEIKALGTLDPRFKAVIDKKYTDYLSGLQMDSTITPGDYIKMTEYSPDKMVYEVNTTKERLAMFSEVYYPPSKGWNVYIDGKKQDPSFIKANYAIRAARVPAGQYKLEMRFEPKSFYTGRTIGLIASLLIFAGVGFLLFMAFRKFNPEELPTEEAALEPLVKVNNRESTRKSKKEGSSKKDTTSRRKPPKRRKK